MSEDSKPARKISPARALREVEQIALEHAALRAQLERCEQTRDRRITRAAQLGIDKATVARAAGMTRQRVGQIVEGRR